MAVAAALGALGLGAAPTGAAAARPYPLHTGIIATVFWVGAVSYTHLTLPTIYSV